MNVYAENVKVSMVPGWPSSTRWEFLSKCLWWYRHFSLSLGFYFSSFVLFRPIPWYCWPYIRKWGLEEKIQPVNISIRTLSLVEYQKSHIRALFAEMWTVYFYGILQIYIFSVFWGAKTFQNGNCNISAYIYPWEKLKGILRWILSL